MYVCMCVCVYVCMCACVCVYVCMWATLLGEHGVATRSETCCSRSVTSHWLGALVTYDSLLLEVLLLPIQYCVIPYYRRYVASSTVYMNV